MNPRAIAAALAALLVVLAGCAAPTSASTTGPAPALPAPATSLAGAAPSVPASASTPVTPSSWQLSPDGLGPITLGGTMKAVEEAKQATFDPEHCHGVWYLAPEAGRTLNAGVVIVDSADRYSSIVALQVGDASVFTPDGLHVGSTRAELTKAWGSSARRTAAETTGMTEVYVEAGDGGFLIAEVAKTSGKVVLFTLVGEESQVASFFGGDSLYCM